MARGVRSSDAERPDEVGVARDCAIRLLTRREHSTVELSRKLKRRGYGPATIDAVIASLSRAESVSDARFAQSFVRARCERGHGPLRIRAGLRERGVGDSLADEVLTESTEFWLERARRVRAKRFGESAPSGRDEWNRQARFLAQRGFPSDLIYRVLGSEDV